MNPGGPKKARNPHLSESFRFAFDKWKELESGNPTPTTSNKKSSSSPSSSEEDTSPSSSPNGSSPKISAASRGKSTMDLSRRSAAVFRRGSQPTKVETPAKTTNGPTPPQQATLRGGGAGKINNHNGATESSSSSGGARTVTEKQEHFRREASEPILIANVNKGRPLPLPRAKSQHNGNNDDSGTNEDGAMDVEQQFFKSLTNDAIRSFKDHKSGSVVSIKIDPSPRNSEEYKNAVDFKKEPSTRTVDVDIGDEEELAQFSIKRPRKSVDVLGLGNLDSDHVRKVSEMVARKKHVPTEPLFARVKWLVNTRHVLAEKPVRYANNSFLTAVEEDLSYFPPDLYNNQITRQLIDSRSLLAEFFPPPRSHSLSEDSSAPISIKIRKTSAGVKLGDSTGTPSPPSPTAQHLTKSGATTPTLKVSTGSASPTHQPVAPDKSRWTYSRPNRAQQHASPPSPQESESPYLQRKVVAGSRASTAPQTASSAPVHGSGSANSFGYLGRTASSPVVPQRSVTSLDLNAEPEEDSMRRIKSHNDLSEQERAATKATESTTIEITPTLTVQAPPTITTDTTKPQETVIVQPRPTRGLTVSMNRGPAPSQRARTPTPNPPIEPTKVEAPTVEQKPPATEISAEEKKEEASQPAASAAEGNAQSPSSSADYYTSEMKAKAKLKRRTAVLSPMGAATRAFDPSTTLSNILAQPIDTIEEEDRDDLVFMTPKSGTGRMVKGGSIEALVEILTRQKDNDPAFVEAFLLTYPSFTTPTVLLEKLVERYQRVPPPNLTPGQLIRFEDETLVIRLRVCSVAKSWVDKYSYDFQKHKELVKRFLEFMEYVHHCGMTKVSTHICRALERKLSTVDDKRVITPTMSNKTPMPIVPKGDITLMNLDEVEVARQLSLLDYESYYQIKPRECLNQAWTKANKEEESPNIIAMIRSSNSVPFWVATEIVQEEKLSKRVAIVKKFIMIAEQCRILNNFAGVMEIISGLSLTPVYRLKKTWELLPKKQQAVYSQLTALMAPKGNFKVYREVLHTIDPPCVPFLGRYLTDLTFIEDAIPDKLEGGLINFVKRMQLSIIIREIQQYQQAPYLLTVVPAIRSYITKFTLMSESELYARSRQIEPPEQ